MSKANTNSAVNSLEAQNDILWQLSRSQINAPLNISDELRRIISTAANFLKTDRTSIWLFKEQHQLLDCQALYHLEKKRFQIDAILHASENSDFFKLCTTENYIAINSVNNAETYTAKLPQAYIEKNDVSSLLYTPLFLGSNLEGLLCLEYTAKEHQWSSEEICFASSIASSATLAIEEQKRKETSSYIKAGLENCPHAALVFSSDGTIKKANKKTSEIFEYTNNNLLNLNIKELLPSIFKDNSELLSDLSHKTETNQTRQSIQASAISKTGQTLTVEYTLHTIIQWQEPHALILLADISEKINIEKKLIESEQLYKNVVHTQQDLVILVKKGGIITFANSAFCQYVDLTQEEVKLKTIYDFTPKEDQIIFLEAVKTLSPDNPMAQYSHRGIVADGSHYIFNWVLRAFFDKKGEIIEFQAIGHDVTQEHADRGQLRQSQRLESLAVLSGGMAHEFNNLLTPILSFTDMALSSLPKDSSQHECLSHVLDASNKAKDLVKKVLIFNKREQNKERELIDAGSYLQDLTSFLQNIVPKRIEFNASIDSNCGFITANPSDLYQILSNLCSNAVHAMPSSGELSLKAFPEIIAGVRYIKIEVEDTGKGIAGELIEKLFDPFFTTKVIGQGTGLGLAVVNNLVQELNGKISCQSILGKGTIFTALLPSFETELDSPEVKSVTEILPGQERILILDDEKSIAAMIHSGLSNLGYSVESRTSVNAALSFFKTNYKEIDMIVTDFTMPNMTGIEFAWHARNLKPNIPIILISGYGQMISEEELQSAGIHHLLQKPFLVNDLASLMRKVFEENE